MTDTHMLDAPGRAEPSELPDELVNQRPRMDPAVRAEKLAKLGQVIAKKRDEAVKYRKESGIEEIWTACEDAYLGRDQANMGEFEKARWAKPTSLQGPVTTSGAQVSGNKSTAYVRLTTRYVDMGAAKVSEICLPIDDKAFSFGPTPVPDLVAAKYDRTPIRDASGALVWRDAKDEEMAGLIQGNPAAAFMGAQEGQKPQVPVTRADVAEAKMQAAKAAATKGEQRVYDWMVESRYPMQMRKVIHDSARLGVGVLKGPFPDRRTGKAYIDGKLEITERISPACKWIDAWNFFPAAGCGENVQEADGVFERDFLSPSGLKALKKLKYPGTDNEPGATIYLADQIDKVLEEGPEKCNTEQGTNPAEKDKKNRFPIWYWTGTLNREEMELLDAPGVDELPDEVVDCFCIVTLVNDSPIRATFNPLTKSGRFGYRVYPWSRRAGHWAGVGVAEQVFLPQRMVNAGTRAWMNNAGISSGVQIFFDQHKVVPMDGNWDVTPNKFWGLTMDGAADDVRKIMMAIEIPNLGDKLKAIIDYAFQLAEEQSNIPLIAQGQVGPNDPQTFGQAELQNGNAQTLLRQQAYSLDDHVTEPLVEDFYEWLLLDPDVPDDEKGDFRINARGSIAMVEKAIQEQTLLQMLGLSKDPTWGQDPKKMFAQVMRTKRLDPDLTAYTPEELAQMQSQPQPKAPAVEAAEIRAASAEKIAQAREQTAQVRIKTDTDRDQVYAHTQREREEIAANSARERLTVERELALIKYATQEKISLEDAKTRLAAKAMELNTQIRLSLSGPAPQVATPPVEPPGRAQDGYSYQQ